MVALVLLPTESEEVTLIGYERAWMLYAPLQVSIPSVGGDAVNERQG